MPARPRSRRRRGCPADGGSGPAGIRTGCDTIPRVTAASAPHLGQTNLERLSAWWRDGSGGLLLYRELRAAPSSSWSDALAAMPEDDGPAPIEPPDRPPARSVDLPEVLALRAKFHDEGMPFDTSGRLMQAMTQTVGKLDDLRPMLWTCDDIARRCAQIVENGETNLWSTLEVVREFWSWHPDRPFVEHQGRRLIEYLERVMPEAGDQ